MNDADQTEMLRQLELLRSHIERVAQSYGIYPAEDVFQEVVLRCCRAAMRINWHNNQSAWVMTVAINVVIDLSRRCRVRREIGGLDEAGLEGGLPQDEPTSEAMDSGVIQRVIGRLRPSIQTVIRAKFWEQRPDEDVAHELGVTTAAVRQMRSRGMKQMRLSLAQEDTNDREA